MAFRRARYRNEDDIKMNIRKNRVGGYEMDSAGSEYNVRYTHQHGNEFSMSMIVRQFIWSAE